MSNLSILERNTLLGFQHCEQAESAYLFALERMPEADAFHFSDKVQHVFSVIDNPIDTAFGLHGVAVSDENKADLKDFITKRMFHLLGKPKAAIDATLEASQ